LVAPALGTPPQRTARDELTYETLHTARGAFGREVRRYDPQRVILTGDAILHTSAWHNWKEDSWAIDNPEQFAEMLAFSNPDPTNLVSVHLYDKDSLCLNHVLAAARDLNKPVFVGEFGVKGLRADSEVKFGELLAAIETNAVPLAAVWVFDFQPQGEELNITATNDRAFQLRAVAEANRRIQAAAVPNPKP
jgi:hypothetical protein